MTVAFTREDVDQLATLARLSLSDQEKDVLAGELGGILETVSVVQKFAEGLTLTPTAGVLHNVTRDDGAPRDGGSFTPRIMENAPDRDGDLLKVHRILG